MDLLEKYGGWLFGVLVGIIAWFSRRDLGRYDKGLDRLAELERDAVTHDELDKILDQLREERAAQHAENRAWLGSIEGKIDSNQTAIHAVAISVASLRASQP